MRLSKKLLNSPNGTRVHWSNLSKSIKLLLSSSIHAENVQGRVLKNPISHAEEKACVTVGAGTLQLFQQQKVYTLTLQRSYPAKLFQSKPVCEIVSIFSFLCKMLQIDIFTPAVQPSSEDYTAVVSLQCSAPHVMVKRINKYRKLNAVLGVQSKSKIH